MPAEIAIIGLEKDLEVRIISRVAETLNRRPGILRYFGVPRAFAEDGHAQLEHPSAMALYVNPKIVLWYGYFDSDRTQGTRMALALSQTPSFPDIRYTLPLDDKMMAMLLTLRSNCPRGLELDEPFKLPRGFMAKGQHVEINQKGKVFKWGNGHCGEGKTLVQAGKHAEMRFGPPIPHNEDLLVESFIEGESYRVLIVGQYASVLHYESKDWRKNVDSTITRVTNEYHPESVSNSHIDWMTLCAKSVARSLHLDVVGIDFILDTTGKVHLLEVNAYPSLEEDPDGKTAFVKLAAEKVVSALS